jgi:RNA binding exosome subunit
MAQCKVYSIVEHEKKLFVLKLDGLKKHNDKQMCEVDQPNKEVGKSYINFDKQHVENEKIYTITRCDGIQLQAM